MYMKKLRTSDRLKKQVHFSWSTSAKLEHECKLQIARTAKVSPLLTLCAAFTGSCNCVVFEKFTRAYDQIALEIMLIFKYIFELISQDIICILVVVSRVFSPLCLNCQCLFSPRELCRSCPQTNHFVYILEASLCIRFSLYLSPIFQ